MTLLVQPRRGDDSYTTHDINRPSATPPPPPTPNFADLVFFFASKVPNFDLLFGAQKTADVKYCFIDEVSNAATFRKESIRTKDILQ